MRVAFVALILSGLLGSGCSTSKRTCRRVLKAAGAIVLVGAATAAIDRAIDPKPAESDTVEGQRKSFEWEQRHEPSFDDGAEFSF